MKRFFLLLALASGGVLGMAQQKCEISGHLEGIKTDTLLVYVIDKQYRDPERIDTVAMSNGDFKYTLEDKDMRMLLFTGKPEEGVKDFTDGFFYISSIPGETAILNGSLRNWTVSGSSFYTLLNKYNEENNPIEAEMRNLNVVYQERVGKGENEETVGEELNKLYAELLKKQADLVKRYIQTFPDSYLAGCLLPNLNADERGEYEALISERVKNGPTALYWTVIKEREERQRQLAEAADKLQPGVPAPDFTLTDINGKPLSLSSLRGKYVLLDFWGSWCGWCIKGFPDLKNSYEKHKDKIEFLGIACRDTDKKWKDAVAKYELPWLHVLNTGDVDVTTLYAIQGFPTKIVVDPQGKIAKVVIGEDPAFYTYLDEIFM